MKAELLLVLTFLLSTCASLYAPAPLEANSDEEYELTNANIAPGKEILPLKMSTTNYGISLVDPKSPEARHVLKAALNLLKNENIGVVDAEIIEVTKMSLGTTRYMLTISAVVDETPSRASIVLVKTSERFPFVFRLEDFMLNPKETTRQ